MPTDRMDPDAVPGVSKESMGRRRKYRTAKVPVSTACGPQFLVPDNAKTSQCPAKNFRIQAFPNVVDMPHP